MKRRTFLKAATLSPAIGQAMVTGENKTLLPNTNASGSRFKLSLNAYSFNDPLRKGSTDLFAVMDFCVREGFDAIDLTGYYFPGYPAIPDNNYLFRLKKKAHLSGLAISGTGIRNEFAEPDAVKRKAEIEFVKQWIEVAARLGAPVIRVYTGKTVPPGYTREETEKWIVDALQQCVAHAAGFGVTVAVQNHNDFIKTAAQMQSVIDKVNHPWFGLVLDTGSFVTEEPYSEIQKMANYAVNWQIKEKLNYQGKSMDMDLKQIFRIAKSSSYRGYLPIETLSPGDPFQIVPPFLQQVKKALDDVMHES
jgi:sugar phosphate isomerase/epimerase